MNAAHQVILHLSLLDKVGPAVVDVLIKHKPESMAYADLYNLSSQDLMSTFDLTMRQAQLVSSGLADKTELEKTLEQASHAEIRIVSLLDEEYPASLAHIHLPPPVLYCKGGPLVSGAHIAVVGSRDANEYAQRAVDELVPALVNHGWTIVSGGARGVDTFAHQAALNAGGKTIAVLGSGLLRLYPPQNKKLFEHMLAQGCTIISSFKLHEQPFPGNFPARNRVISGLSSGCLVIQAAEQSGARITATHALEQGRSVFAVPGSIFDPLSAGCHALIVQGATLVTSAPQLLHALGHEVCQELAQPEPLEVQLSIAEVDSPEGRVVRLCRQACSFDDLQEHTGLTFVELNDLLFGLQIEGKLVQNGIGLWQSR